MYFGLIKILLQKTGNKKTSRLRGQKFYFGQFVYSGMGKL